MTIIYKVEYQLKIVLFKFVYEIYTHWMILIDSKKVS